MSCSASYNRSVLSKLSWMSRQLRQYEDLQSIQLWANSMHLVKNLLIMPVTPEKKYLNASHVSSRNETSSDRSSPSTYPNMPCNYSTCPPGFLPHEASTFHHKSRKDEHFLKTGLYTTSVSRSNLNKERCQQLNKWPLGSKARSSNSSKRISSLSVNHLPAITCASKLSAIIDESRSINISYPPRVTTCHTISPPLQVSFYPAVNCTKAQASTKPVFKIKQHTVFPDFAAKWSKLSADFKEPLPSSHCSTFSGDCNISPSNLQDCNMLKLSKNAEHSSPPVKDLLESISKQNNVDKGKIGWKDLITWKKKYRLH